MQNRGNENIGSEVNVNINIINKFNFLPKTSIRIMRLYSEYIYT